MGEGGQKNGRQIIYITAALMTTNGANTVTSSVVEMQYCFSPQSWRIFKIQLSTRHLYYLSKYILFITHPVISPIHTQLFL